MSTCRAVHRRDRAAIGDDDRVVVEQLVELVGDDLRLHRRVGAGAALRHQFAPVAACPSAPVRGTCRCRSCAQQRQQLGADALAVADEADFDRVAKPDPLRVEFDLDAACLPGLRIIFDVGEARCRRSAACRSSSSASCDGLVPSIPTPPVVIRAVVRHRLLAEQRLADRRPRRSASCEQLVARADRAAAGEDERLLALVEDVGGALQHLLGSGSWPPRRHDVRHVVRRRCAPTGGLLAGIDWKSTGIMTWVGCRDRRAPCGRPARRRSRHAPGP